MTSPSASGELLGALSRLLTEARSAPLALDTAGVEDARQVRAEVCSQLADYVIPRLIQMDAPLLAVVGGSTGAGKSTLVNSLVGDRVTESGVLRPTTRSPVLVHHPHDAQWFESARVLPDLPRSGAGVTGTRALQLVSTFKVPRGVAILDAPDFDSLESANRELAAQLLGAADLWLFVTSAARYADQVPWDYLRKAIERDAAVAVVLDRTSVAGIAEVRAHLARLMTSRGLSDAPVFTVAETVLRADGLLPEGVVAPIVDWFAALAADDTGRAAIIAQTLDGAIRHDVYRSFDVADAIDEQIAASGTLQDSALATYRAALDVIDTETRDGSLVKGPLVSHWQEFVASGEMMRAQQESRLSNRVIGSLQPGRTSAVEVSSLIARGLSQLIVDGLETSAARTAQAWQDVPAGRALLAQQLELGRASREALAKVDPLVREWQQGVATMAGGDDHGVALMVVCLAGPGVENGPTAPGVRYLEALLGDRLPHVMVDAQTQLVSRVAGVLDAELTRFLGLFTSPDTVRSRQNALREAAQRADYARHINVLDGGLR